MMTTHSARLHGLDALRGSMMLLGIVVHAAFFHLLLATARAEPLPAVPLALAGLIHQFRMPLFFVLAGFFMATLVRRSGPEAAFIHRARRILLPLLLCLPTLLPLTLWLCFSVFLSGAQGRSALVGPDTDLAALMDLMRTRGMSEPVNLFHLWFLYYLFIYCAGAAACASLGRRWQLPVAPGWLAHPLALPALIALTALTLAPFPDALVVVSDPPLRPAPAALAYHGVFFAAGYLLRESDLALLRQRGTARMSLLALGATAAFALLQPGSPGDGAPRALLPLVAATSTWAWIHWLCGLALGRWHRDTGLTRFVAQSAYWIYLVHMPLVLGIGLLLDRWEVPALVALPLDVLLTAALGAWSYARFVRGSWLGMLLNGRRYDRAGGVVELRPAASSG